MLRGPSQRGIVKIARLTIKNFRGISEATLDFESHALLLGINNVGRSTICEALDLVLGPDRLSKFPQVDEFDFYNPTISSKMPKLQFQLKSR